VDESLILEEQSVMSCFMKGGFVRQYFDQASWKYSRREDGRKMRIVGVQVNGRGL